MSALQLPRVVILEKSEMRTLHLEWLGPHFPFVSPFRVRYRMGAQ